MWNIKIDKVIVGLTCCQYDSKSHCDGCPYRYEDSTDINSCTSDLASDAVIVAEHYRGAVPILECISDQIHETASMFRRPVGEEADDSTSEWVKMHGMMIPELHGYHECLKCGYHEDYHNRETLYPFCPACGRKMKNGIQRKG